MSDSGIATNGPFVIGYTLCFGLMGALAVQAYIYFTRFTDDRRATKALVIVVLLLETSMTISVFAGFWMSSTQGYFNISPTFVAALVLAPMTGLVTTLTHGFFCWRIASLRTFYPLPIPIMMVSLLQLASIIYFALTDGLFPSNESFTNNSPLQPSYKLSPWLVTWLGSSVVCDLAITICMILSLRPSQSYFRSNKSTLAKLTRLSIETGLVTTVAALLELILGVVFQTTYYHIAVFYAISKLYANCLLASLNFRLVLRSQSDPNLTAIVWDSMAPNTQSRQPGFQPTRVHILAQVESDVDVDVDLSETGPRKYSSPEDQTSATSSFIYPRESAEIDFTKTYELADRSTWV